MGLKIRKNRFNYFPTSRNELKDIIKKRIDKEGINVDLNDIDTSEITDMNRLFADTNFCGNISDWDTSKVTDMSDMFQYCQTFIGEGIENWDVSNVVNFSGMFMGCKKFNANVGKWDITSAEDLDYMFYGCEKFNQDLRTWKNAANIKHTVKMFKNCPTLNQEYIPEWAN